MLYFVLSNCGYHTIVDCISLDILLPNSLYQINWHYCSSREVINLSCSSEEITMAYWFEKHPFSWPIRITTLFEYQTRWSKTEAVPSWQSWIINASWFLQLCREWDFTMGFELSRASTGNTMCLGWECYVILLVTSIHDPKVNGFSL